MAVDLVCKMAVNEGTGLKSMHGSKTYYFCSAGCKQQFDANPTKFAGK